MEESLLEKLEGTIDNDNETITWVEYRYEGKLVHRSAQVILKKAISPFVEVASLG
jgi:hypothetical protein